MNALTTSLLRFGPGRLAAMGAVTLALVGFFAFVTMRVSTPAMGVLFSDLSGSDSAAIAKELDSRGVTYSTRDDGATVLVPRADIARIRMDLASKSLPSGGGVGYEIFDKGDAFSSTSFVQGINQLRALEGELARTIRTIGRVQAARVHLALPERRLFERDREPPRASIVLKTRGELGSDQVAAIRHLVASAVQGLSPDRVSVVDERGRLLADAGQGDSPLAGTAAGEDRRVGIERRMRTQIEEILSPIVGVGRARVQVAAELELNRVESRQESYDPESRVVRSSQTRGETSTTGSTEGQVSVGNELPGARGAEPATPAAPRDASSKTEEVVNYEISRTTRTEVQEPGRVKRLSVAVVVDGTYAKGPNGEPVYQPRPAADLERIGALVRGAIGFDKGRGDVVEVANMPLAEAPAAVFEEPSSWSSLLSFTREDLMRFVEIGVLSLLSVIVLMVVVRPLVKRVIAPDGALLASLGLAGRGEPLLAGAGGAGGTPQLEASGGPAGALTAPSPAPVRTAAIPSEAGGSVSLPNVSADLFGSDGALGPSPAEQIARLGELARTNPKEAATVLRGWMNER